MVNSEKEIYSSRVIHAPIHKVYHAFENPNHLKKLVGTAWFYKHYS